MIMIKLNFKVLMMIVVIMVVFVKVDFNSDLSLV